MEERLWVFSNIAEQEREKMRVCFQARRELFPAGARILAYSRALERVGILLAGSAHLTCTDDEGHSSILEHLEAGDIFGEVFALPACNLSYDAVAVEQCEVLFIDYRHIVKSCPNACAHHSQLVSNILQLSAKKAQALSEHINVLSQRTIRQKLLTYFHACRARHQSDAFVLPMTLTALADYLSVDRSAMMREMKRMKDAGILVFRGRDVRLTGDRDDD